MHACMNADRHNVYVHITPSLLLSDPKFDLNKMKNLLNILSDKHKRCHAKNYINKNYYDNNYFENEV